MKSNRRDFLKCLGGTATAGIIPLRWERKEAISRKARAVPLSRTGKKYPNVISIDGTDYSDIVSQLDFEPGALIDMTSIDDHSPRYMKANDRLRVRFLGGGPAVDVTRFSPPTGPTSEIVVHTMRDRSLYIFKAVPFEKEKVVDIRNGQYVDISWIITSEIIWSKSEES